MSTIEKVFYITILIGIALATAYAVHSCNTFFAGRPDSIEEDSAEVVKGKTTNKTVVVTKPDGTQVHTVTQIVESETVVEKIKVLKAPRPSYSLGFSAEIRPQLTALKPVYTAEVGRRLFGPAWGTVHVSTDLKNVTAVGFGVRVDF
jgi:hypothetical protein